MGLVPTPDGPGDRYRWIRWRWGSGGRWGWVPCVGGANAGRNYDRQAVIVDNESRTRGVWALSIPAQEQEVSVTDSGHQLGGGGSPAPYTRTARALHWLIAAALFAQIGFGWFLDSIPRGTPA